jgi:eukaryotic-like serine/threonine-protein kinase
MGDVYRARDSRLGRDVAIKVLPAGVATDPDRLGRFEREAKAVAALSHPNILAIFDFALADGTAYAVTELLQGETLRHRLDAPLPVRKAIDIATQIARGLSAAHDKGIVHRDLKPENVFLLADGQVKILDFGLAKATGDEPGNDTQTVAGTDPGTVLGTVGYMAPEQVRGQAVDARADLFALGAVLYEMLAGQRAFERETTAETMTAILKDDPPDLALTRADLPPALESVVRHCLERSPSERFQSARDLIFNLQAAATASGSGPTSGVASASPSRPTFPKREAIAWLLVAALAAVSIGSVVFLRVLRPAEPAPAIARFQVSPPDKTTWASPLGAPDGTNSGTISPDGMTLAFVAADSAGKSLLWVRPIDSFTARALPGTEGASFPFWSADSRSLAFFTQARVRRISVDGGPARTVTEFSGTPRGGSWNGDGVILLATAGSPILRVPAEGGQPTPVTKPDAQNTGPVWPSFLPDGRRFLYYGSSSRAVYLASLEAGTIKHLLQSDTNAIFAAPDQILFIREGSLFAQRFDEKRSEIAGEPVPVAEQVSWNIAPWNLGAFSASANGRLTYRFGGGTRSQFAWVDSSGRQLGLVGPPGDYLSPALSPDGTKVAFMRRDDQPAGDIWILDLGRSQASRFTFSPLSDIYPLWSPDGSAIIYESMQDGVISSAVDGTGGQKHLFATTGFLVPSQITPDGKSLLFFGDLGNRTGFDLFLLALTGDAKPTPIVQSPLSEVECQISPDGKWIAYASTESGAYDVFVQPFPPTGTGAKKQISSGGGRQPMWRADGRELFYVTNDRKFYAVGIRAGSAFESDSPRFLFDMPSNTISVRNSYVPSRDGQRFLVNMLLDTAIPPINVDLNWMSPAKK